MFIFFLERAVKKLKLKKFAMKLYGLVPYKIKNIITAFLIKNRSKKLLKHKVYFSYNGLNVGKHCFAAQPEYFRQCYFDFIGNEGVEYPISSLDRSSMKDLRDFCLKENIKNLWLFRPEFFVEIKDALTDLKNNGISIICYSTEPIPSLDEFKSNLSHTDQLKRLNSLIESNVLPYDFFIHFDQNSESLLRYLGFNNIISYPLPVSFKIFKPLLTDIKYDVCFIGRSTDHRETFLGPLKAYFNTIHIAHGVFDEDANHIMNQSRIVLNLHNEPYKNFETRVIQAKLINAILISEPLSLDLVNSESEFIEINTPAALFDQVKTILNATEKYEKVRQNFKNREVFQFSNLVKKLSEIELLK
jgi:hypothetical protein